MSVELVGVTKAYGNAAVLHPLSLALAPGELVALLGPSGCGKTTTLRLVAGLDTADAGIIRLDGVDVTALPPERRGLGMVFQQYAIWPHRTVAENVAYPLERAGVARAERARRVQEALGLVHLGALEQRRPEQLSGGQLQRVALARALVARPRVLLLDEPLSNLDAALREELGAEIRALQRRLGITTLLVTHDQAEALSLADRVAVMNAGRLEQLAPPAEVYARPRTAFVARFVGGGNVLAARIEKGRVRCGALTLPAPDGARDGDVEIVVRPEDLHLAAEGAPARVTERFYRGDRVELRLRLGDADVRAVVPASEGDVPLGAEVRVAARRCWVLGGDPY